MANAHREIGAMNVVFSEKLTQHAFRDDSSGKAHDARGAFVQAVHDFQRWYFSTFLGFNPLSRLIDGVFFERVGFPGIGRTFGLEGHGFHARYFFDNNNVFIQIIDVEILRVCLRLIGVLLAQCARRGSVMQCHLVVRPHSCRAVDNYLAVNGYKACADKVSTL